MSVIKLQSCDGEVFTVDVEVAKLLKTIKNMVDDLGMEDKEDTTPVPLPNVNGHMLGKILEWVEHHKENKDKEDDTSSISTWEKDYLAKLSIDDHFSLILASNYLDVESLLDAVGKAVAVMMDEMEPEEIREKFNIADDLSPQEKEEIIKDAEWIKK